MKSPSRLPAVLALTCLAFGLCSVAEARERIRTGSGPRGNYSNKITRQPGSVQRDTTATGVNGQSVSHTKNRTIDPATGTLTSSASTTLPSGQTTSRSLTSQATETGRSTTATATGPNGNSATLNSSTNKTETGYTRTTSATGPNGQTASTQVDVSKEDGTTTRTATRTKPDGTTTTRTQTSTTTP
jgi:hypothetical protein